MQIASLRFLQLRLCMEVELSTSFNEVMIMEFLLFCETLSGTAQGLSTLILMEFLQSVDAYGFAFSFRPPPKFPRRAAPVEPPTVPMLSSSPGRKDSDSSPSSSLERNIKPSEIFRQKSSDSLDIKPKREVGKFSKSSDLIADEFGKKLAKSESLKSTQSSSGSLGSRDTKSTASPTGSLEKISRGGNSVGSKESINSGLTSGVASTKIKSFESISSLSSDSVKIGQHIESEPYYDTVPMESHHHDSEFVFLQSSNATNTMTSTGTTGSSSSRDEVLSNAGSTLPMHIKSHLSSQTSVVEPESPGRSSNYVNIDYFLQ